MPGDTCRPREEIIDIGSWDHYLATVAAQGVSRAVGLAAAFGAYVLATRVLGPESLGQLAFVMAFVTVGASLADLGTNAAFTKGLAEAKRHDPSGYYGNYLLVRLFLGVAALMAGVSVVFFIKPELTSALVVGCVAIPLVAARFFDVVYQVFKRVRFAVFTALLLGVSQLSGVMVALLWLKAGLLGYMIAFVVAQSAYCCAALAFSLRLVRPRFRIDGGLLRSMLTLAAPIGVSALFNLVYSRADVFMLSYMRGDYDVGIYNAAYRLLDLAAVVAASVAAPVVPIFTRVLVEDRARAANAGRRIMECVVLVLLPLPLVAPYVSELLITGLYGVDFRESAMVLPIFAWLFIIMACVMIASSINLAAGNVAYAYWSSAVTAAINLSLNWILIPAHGVMGAAIATLVSALFMLGVTQWYVRRSIGGGYALDRWLRIGACGLAMELTLGQSVGAGVILPVAGSILVYLLATVVTGVFPKEIWRALLATVSRR